MLSYVLRLLLQSGFHFLPRMGVEEETLFHSFGHVLKAAHGNGEAQFVGSYVGAYRRVEEPDKAAIPLPVIL